MIISGAAVPAARPTYAQMQMRREMALAAKAEEKRTVAENVAEAMQTARFEAPERAKQQAKAKLVEVAKKLQLLRKLFAYNPKEMARALTHVMKELRAAVKAYKDAGGQESGFAGEAARTAVANDAASKTDAAAGADEGQADSEQIDANQAAASADGETDGAPEGDAPETAPDAQANAAQASAIYDAVVGKMRKSIGEDGLDFIKMVRQMINGAMGIRDMLESARTQAKGGKSDKATGEAFEDADKQMKALAEDLDKMERDIRHAAPDAGMKLSMDA